MITQTLKEEHVFMVLQVRCKVLIIFLVLVQSVLRHTDNLSKTMQHGEQHTLMGVPLTCPKLPPRVYSKGVYVPSRV